MKLAFIKKIIILLNSRGKGELPQERPVEQLKLLHAEVDRQRSMLAQRLANLHTRAAILVTAAGVLSTYIAANWSSTWQTIGVVSGAIAAVIGLSAMKPRIGTEVNATLGVYERLCADPYSAQFSIVDDNIAALADDFKGLRSTGKLVIIGYTCLVFAWLSTLVVAALTSLNFI